MYALPVIFVDGLRGMYRLVTSKGRKSDRPILEMNGAERRRDDEQHQNDVPHRPEELFRFRLMDLRGMIPLCPHVSLPWDLIHHINVKTAVH